MYHPDKNKEEGATDKFHRVNLAYRTMLDTACRRNIDAQLQLQRLNAF